MSYSVFAPLSTAHHTQAMSLSFKTFRRIVLGASLVCISAEAEPKKLTIEPITGIMSVNYCAALGIAVYVHFYFEHQSNIAVLYAIGGTMLVWCVSVYVHSLNLVVCWPWILWTDLFPL